MKFMQSRICKCISNATLARGGACVHACKRYNKISDYILKVKKKTTMAWHNQDVISQS